MKSIVSWQADHPENTLIVVTAIATRDNAQPRACVHEPTQPPHASQTDAPTHLERYAHTLALLVEHGASAVAAIDGGIDLYG